MAVGPFDIIKAVSFTKQRIIDENNEKDYNSFIVNRALSYFPDTVLYANDMNLSSHLDGQLQFDYLFYSLRKKNRWSKWLKQDQSDTIKKVSEYLQLSYEKTRTAMSVMGPEKVKEILERVSR